MSCTPIWLTTPLSTPTSWPSQALIRLCFFYPTVGAPHLSFSWRVIVAVSSPPHTRSLTRLSINRHCPNGSIYSSASTSRSSSPTPVDNLLGVNHPDWRQLSRRQPDRCPSSTILATLTPIHLSQKSRSRNPCLVPSSLIHGWVSTSRKTRTGQANSWT
jgi:hypothetical protein